MRKSRRLPVVMAIDGGICSQILFVAMGEWLKRHCNCDVKYDVRWYDSFNCARFGKGGRNLDFMKAFPAIHLELASCYEIRHVQSKRKWNGLGRMPRLPFYYTGYHGRDVAFVELIEEFKRCFRPELDSCDQSLLNRICSEGEVCAVHCRRGDLANGNPGYGHPTSVGYFVRAVKIVHALHPGVRYLFFSDDPKWVCDCVVPELPSWCRCEVVSDHGEDKGYVDLYLMSRCPHVISSIGSLGYFASLLSNCSKTCVTSCQKGLTELLIPNLIYLNDDREFRMEKTVDGRSAVHLSRRSHSLFKWLFG